MADFVLDEYKNLNEVNIPLPSSVYIQCEPDRYAYHMTADDGTDYYDAPNNMSAWDNLEFVPVKDLNINDYNGQFGGRCVLKRSYSANLSVKLNFPTTGIYVGICYIRITRYYNRYENGRFTDLCFRYDSLPSFQFTDNKFSALNNSYNNPEIKDFYNSGTISSISTYTYKTVSLTTPRSFTSSDNWEYNYTQSAGDQEHQIYYCYSFIRLA